MKFRSLFVALVLALTFAGCPKKNSEGELSSEPVEGASSANNESSTESAPEEMQEKKEGAPATDVAPVEPAPEEKK